MRILRSIVLSLCVFTQTPGIVEAASTAPVINYNITSGGSVNMAMGSTSSSEEAAERITEASRLFESMLKQGSLYSNEAALEEFQTLNPAEQQKKITALYYSDRRKYLYAKWLQDSKQSFSEKILNPLLNAFLVYGAMSMFASPSSAGDQTLVVNENNSSKQENLATGVALGAVFSSPQFAGIIPAAREIAGGFVDIYSPEIQKMSPVISYSISAVFGLSPRLQDQIVQKYLSMVPQLTPRTKDFLVPRIGALQVQRDIKPEDLHKWMQGFNWFTGVSQESFKPVFDMEFFRNNFKGYSLSIQKELWNFMSTYRDDSERGPGPRGTPKTIYYFQGHPGVGKTHAAKNLLATALGGAPFYDIELSTLEALLGKPTFPPSETDVSQLLKALHSTTKLGQKARNPIFFIDEFDKLVNDPSKRDLVKFFYSLFEGEQELVNLGGMDFDISHIAFIVAGNSAFESPSLEEDSSLETQLRREPGSPAIDDTQRIAAIRDRLHIVKFPDLTNHNKKVILAQKLQKFLEKEKKKTGGVVLTEEDICSEEAVALFEELIEKDQSNKGARGIIRGMNTIMGHLRVEKQKLQELRSRDDYPEFSSEEPENDVSFLDILNSQIHEGSSSEVSNFELVNDEPKKDR